MHVITVAEARAQGSTPAAIMSVATWNDRVAKNPTHDADRRATAAKVAPRLRQVALKLAEEDGVKIVGAPRPAKLSQSTKRKPQNDNQRKPAPSRGAKRRAG